MFAEDSGSYWVCWQGMWERILYWNSNSKANSAMRREAVAVKHTCTQQPRNTQEGSGRPNGWRPTETKHVLIKQCVRKHVSSHLPPK